MSEKVAPHKCGAPTLMSPNGKIRLRSCRNRVRGVGYCWLHRGGTGSLGVRRA